MNSNGIITAPINVKADVAAVLGESTTSVSALCKSNKINMWAKWKPIPYGSIETPSKEVKKSLNYGLTNFAWGGETVAIQQALQLNGGIIYEGPNDLYPYCRLGDFDGYNHEAPNPILNSRVSLSTSVISNRVGNNLGISFFLSLPTDNEDTITLHDILEIQDAYPAVLLCKRTKLTGPGGVVSYSYRRGTFWTSDKTLKEYANTAISLSVPVGNVPKGDYNAVVCFSKYKFNWDGNWTEAGSYPSINLAVLPILLLSTTNGSLQYVLITLYSEGGSEPGGGSFSWSCSAELEKVPYESGIYHIKWSVSINNWGSSDISLSNNYIYITHTDWLYGQALDNGEMYRILPNFSKGVDGPGIVAEGEESVDANYSWKIYVTLGSRKYTKTTFAFKPTS